MRPLLPLLLFLMAFSYPLTGCKKKGETETDVALEADAESSSEESDQPEKKRKGKKRKKKGKKGKQKAKQKKAKVEAAKEEADEAELRAVKSARHDAPLREDNGGELATAGVKATGEPAAALLEVPRRAVEPRPAPVVVTPPPVTVAVARLLTVIDVNRLLKEKGWIAYGPVQGIPPSEYFNSLIYRKPGTNRFVTALVWKLPQYSQALEKWNEMAATYPNTQELKEKFAKFIFFSYRNQVSTLTALHEEKSTVISVSCHNEVCDDTALYEMAKTAFGRVR